MTREDVCASGCSFGSLAAEIMKSDLDVHDEVTAGFGRWRDLFERGLAAMRERGELRRGADPGQLASALMAAFQGGMLLSQATQDVTPCATRPAPPSTTWQHSRPGAAVTTPGRRAGPERGVGIPRRRD